MATFDYNVRKPSMGRDSLSAVVIGLKHLTTVYVTRYSSQDQADTGPSI